MCFSVVCSSCYHLFHLYFLNYSFSFMFTYLFKIFKFIPLQKFSSKLFHFLTMLQPKLFSQTIFIGVIDSLFLLPHEHQFWSSPNYLSCFADNLFQKTAHLIKRAIILKMLCFDAPFSFQDRSSLSSRNLTGKLTYGRFLESFLVLLLEYINFLTVCSVAITRLCDHVNNM